MSTPSSIKFVSLFREISLIFRDGPLFLSGGGEGLPFLGLADNFFGRVMRFKQFFSLHFVMETE